MPQFNDVYKTIVTHMSVTSSEGLGPSTLQKKKRKGGLCLSCKNTWVPGLYQPIQKCPVGFCRSLTQIIKGQKLLTIG